VSDERLAALGYRRLLVENYIAFYIVNDTLKTIEVDRVLYARRDWRHLL
jgi:plasmid stabilization system protein ParE